MRVARRVMMWAIFLAVTAICAVPVSANPRLLVDMRSGEVLFADEAGAAWHPASLTKLMTAYVAFEAISDGRLSLKTPVIMSARAVREPPSKSGLPIDTALTLKDALYLMLVKSANDVAIAVAETVSGSVEDFVFEMNLTAKALGLTGTHYVNPNGLHDPEQVTTARDLAILALNIRIRHPEYDDIFATEAVKIGNETLESNNNLLTDFAGTTGMKTGFVCSSGLNMVATAERGSRDLMAVILGSASSRERGEEAAQLMLEGFSGQLNGQGTIGAISNDHGPVTDMRPQICGKEAKAYVSARSEAYPYGLKGEPSFLQDDSIAPRTYTIHLLGRMRNVPLPKPRPLWAPEAASSTIPLPRARPAS